MPFEGVSHKEIAEELFQLLTKHAEMRYWGGSFNRWNGSHWEKVHESEILKLIGEEYGNLPAAKRYADYRGIMSATQNIAYKELSGYDDGRSGLNFANVFLTEDLKLIPHDPDLGMTYCLPYLYEPEKAEHCPQFLQMLEDAWGADPDYIEKVQALREAIGATMMGIGPRFQQAITLYGTSNSGKSQILEIIQGLIPKDAISHVPPADFHDKFKPVALVNAIMNICGEMSEHRNISGEIFKQIVCGEPITVQYKGKDGFDIKPRATHWFATNHLPKSQDSSTGFTRRWLFLEFKHKVPEHRMVREIAKDIIANERSAIAAWAAQSVPALIARKGYVRPSSHLGIIENLSNDLNIVRFFLTRTDVCRVGEGAGTISEKDLHTAFWSFAAQTEGVRPPGLKQFKKMMEGLETELAFRTDVSRDARTGLQSTVYRGVSLR